MKNKDNKFGLVYDNAIEENVPGQVNIHPVAYMVNGLKIAAKVDALDLGHSEIIDHNDPNTVKFILSAKADS